jgi:hypothetical protein
VAPSSQRAAGSSPITTGVDSSNAAEAPDRVGGGFGPGFASTAMPFRDSGRIAPYE